jgi:lipopolysaccharide heptosyltransferase II
MVQWEKIRKVLIIKFLGIGDVLFTTPMLRKLKEKHSHLSITYLTSKLCAPVVINNPNIDEVLTYDMPSRNTLLCNPFPFIRLIKDLRKRNFDAVIVTHRSFSAILFSYLICGSARIGFDYKGWGFLLTDRIPLDGGKYAPALYMDLLQNVCDKKDELGLELNLSKEASIYDQKLFPNNDNGAIAVAPGGGKNEWMAILSKRWPAGNYAELISSLISQKHTVLLLGGKDDIEISNEVKQHISGTVFDFTGKTDILQAAALIQRCRLFVGNDSSLLHIAAALGIPTVSIFGPTNPEYFAPRGEKHIVIKSDANCSPCFTYGKPPKCEDYICMDSVKTEHVLSAVNKLLKQ